MEKSSQKKENTSPSLSLGEGVVKASIQLFTVDPETLMPYGFGSGFIIRYKERFFLVTVFHVIKDDPSQIYIQTGFYEDRRPQLTRISGFHFFSQFSLKTDKDVEELVAKMEAPDNTLDIAFAEVYWPLNLPQVAIDFRHFKVEEGQKIILDMQSAVEPNKTGSYLFSGYIQQKTRGILLNSKPTFKYELTYHRTDGRFHIFLAPEPAIDPQLYRGCSGAPIFNEKGLLVAVTCKVESGAKMIYGFSIVECRRLIDMVLAIEAIENKDLK